MNFLLRVKSFPVTVQKKKGMSMSLFGGLFLTVFVVQRLILGFFHSQEEIK